MTRRRRARQVSGSSLTKAGLDPVATAEHFAARRGQIAAARDAAQESVAASQNKLTEAAVAKRKLDEEAAEVNAELRSLQARKNNIPVRDLEVRERLCRELRLTEESLPFAGELIAVREEEADWEGAAERAAARLRAVGPRSRPALRRRLGLDQRPPSQRPDRLLPGAAGSGDRGSAGPERNHAGGQAGGQGFAFRLVAGAGTRPPGGSRMRRDNGRVPPDAEGDHQGRPGQGRRRQAREGRPVPDRRRGRYVLGWTNERKIEAMISRATARRHGSPRPQDIAAA